MGVGQFRYISTLYKLVGAQTASCSLQAIMRPTIILLVITFLFSCSGSSEQKKKVVPISPVEPRTISSQSDFIITPEDTVRLLTSERTYQLKVDSIGEKSIDEYLINSNILPTAKQLYNGQFELSDNRETFELLEITHQCLDEVRPFYFHLFNYVATVSDGALSEVFGQDVLHLIELRTEFFFKYFENTRDGNLFYRYANFCAYELLMYDENSLEQVNNFEEMILANCPNCEPELVKDFTREIRLFIKRNIE